MVRTIYFLVWILAFFQFWTLACFWMVFENFILCVLDEQQPPGFQIDHRISAAVKDSTKQSTTKSVFDGRMETTITAEKDPNGFKRNSTDLWPSYGYLKQQACNFSVEKIDSFLCQSGLPQL